MSYDPAKDRPDCISEELWAEWIQHRREIGKKLTPLSVKKQAKRLNEWKADGLNPEDSIEDAIAGGWQGLFTPRVDKRAEKERIEREEAEQRRRAYQAKQRVSFTPKEPEPEPLTERGQLFTEQFMQIVKGDA